MANCTSWSIGRSKSYKCFTWESKWGFHVSTQEVWWEDSDMHDQRGSSTNRRLRDKENGREQGKGMREPLWAHE